MWNEARAARLAECLRYSGPAASSQMTRLVDDLLDVSRINAGLIELQQEFLDVGQLVRTVESSLQPDFVAAHQVLTTSIPTEPLYAQGDRIRLTQVFSNVLHNANKYTPDGGRIVVEATREDADIVVRIRDTGIGIPSRDARPGVRALQPRWSVRLIALAAVWGSGSPCLNAWSRSMADASRPIARGRSRHRIHHSPARKRAARYAVLGPFGLGVRTRLSPHSHRR